MHLLKNNVDLFEQTLAAPYDPRSPSYHHCLMDADLLRLPPPKAKIDTVTAALQRGRLAIVSANKYGFWLQACRALGNVARAFTTEIHQVEHNGSPFGAITRPAVLGGEAGRCVITVAGIERHTIRRQLARAFDPLTRKAFPGCPLAQAFAAPAGNPFGTMTEILTQAPPLRSPTPGRPIRRP